MTYCYIGSYSCSRYKGASHISPASLPPSLHGRPVSGVMSMFHHVWWGCRQDLHAYGAKFPHLAGCPGTKAKSLCMFPCSVLNPPRKPIIMRNRLCFKTTCLLQLRGHFAILGTSQEGWKSQPRKLRKDALVDFILTADKLGSCHVE